MALFTDGPPACIGSLREYESAILDVASTEKIDLTVKLAVAAREIGFELEHLLVGTGYGLANVVATEPLKTWHTFHTLVLTFRDAYHSQLNDRYLGKWQEYERRAVWAQGMLRQLGIGIVKAPVPRAPQPELSPYAASAGAATYYVAAAWVGVAGTEGSPSEIAALSVADNNVVAARVSGATASIDGWRVYAGYSPTELWRQTDAPLPPGEVWIAPETGLARGPLAGDGQPPEEYLRRAQTWTRG